MRPVFSDTHPTHESDHYQLDIQKNSVPRREVLFTLFIVEFTTPNVPTQQATKFSAEGTAQNLIDQIKITKFNISAVSSGTTSVNLDYLKSLTIYIKAAGVGEEIVATKSNIPTGSTSVSMDITDTNIKNYIFKDNIQFRVLAIFDASAATDQTLKLDETVHVSATLLK